MSKCASCGSSAGCVHLDAGVLPKEEPLWRRCHGAPKSLCQEKLGRRENLEKMQIRAK